MKERLDEDERQYQWIVYAIAMLLVGGLAGYVLAQTGATTGAGAAALSLPGPSVSIVDEGALRAYRDILARDPRNFQAAVNAGNLLYDAQRYVEAVPFYQQAIAINGSDINVSTDLGTVLWYSGRADEALAQYDRSLAIDPNHAQTLFNVGIVKADGKHDYQGAISAWEKLLDKNPAYPNAGNVRSMIANVRAKAGS